MIEIIIDGKDLHTKQQAHEFFSAQEGFPAKYGKNLDALFDCLGEMRIDKITILNSEKGENYFYSVLDVINDLGIETVME